MRTHRQIEIELALKNYVNKLLSGTGWDRRDGRIKTTLARNMTAC
jgi:hypothetical protein